jgi:predicted MFS family arabinose efflux permease
MALMSSTMVHRVTRLDASTTYWQLLAARIGVAVGEGGTGPPSHSIITDLFPLHRRSTAMAVFSLGPHIGLILGLLVGGWMAHLWGWRSAFYVAGTVGLLFAMVSFGFLREPDRGQINSLSGESTPTMRTVVQTLMGYASLRHLFAGAAVLSIAAYALIGWLPSFLIRGHGLTTAEAGSILALILGLVGGAGTVLGGMLADHLGERDAAWRLRVVVIALLVMAGGWAAVLVESRTAFTLTVLVIPGALLGVYLGPSFAMVQSVVGPRVRATAAAILLFITNVIGLGIGPLAVGTLSDALQPAYGTESLRLALAIVPPLCLWAAFHYHAASRALAADLDNAARIGME